MSAAAAVVNRLDSIPDVVALVSTRIYQGILPQGGAFPAIRVQRIGQNEFMHLRGGVAQWRTRVQIDSVSNSANALASAQAVDAALTGDSSGSALVGWHGSAGSVTITAVLPVAVREAYDAEELRQYKVMRDVFVWWTA